MTRRLRQQAGFTIIEMLIASVIMMAVTGAVFQLMNPTQGTFQAQPEVSDMQQRLRVGVDALSADIVMAGAGAYMGTTPGTLANFFAPIMPYRRGEVNDDPSAGVYFRPDAISIVYIPPTPTQTTVNKAMGNGNSREMDVDPTYDCGTVKQDQLCNFYDGMRVLVYDVDGSWDIVTITNVQASALHLQHSGKLSGPYTSGSAVVTQVATHTYYLKTDNTTKTYQLMHYDGYQTDLPVVDNVVKLNFEYFGDPQPPQRITSKPLSDTTGGPWTTYGPKPPLAAGNCTFTYSSGQHVPRLATLATGVNTIKLTEAQLKDGPWCPDDSAEVKYDADLFRIRQVRVTLRVQAALASLRGPAGVLFTKGGTSSSVERFIPDQEIQFDIAPRNMNLGR